MWGAIKRFFGYHEIVSCVKFDTGLEYVVYVPCESDPDLVTESELEAHLRKVLTNSPHGNVVSVHYCGIY